MRKPCDDTRAACETLRMAPIIHDHPLPYLNALALREASAVRLVVIHCTELPNLAMAREYGERVQHKSGAGNSGHYYIDRDGHIECYVPPTRIAHHVRGLNAHSVGIELVNRGRYPHWWHAQHQAMTEAYPAAQIDALINLLAWLIKQLPALSEIAGHESLDTQRIPADDDPTRQVARKLDPGPLFPWSKVLAAVPLQRIHAAAQQNP